MGDRNTQSLSYCRAARLLITTLGIIFWTTRASAQNLPAAKVNATDAAFLEVGGPGGFYSVNYDHLLDDVLSLRAGATSWSTTSFDKQGEKVDAAILGATLRYDISRFVDRIDGRYLEAGATITFGSHSRSSYGTSEASGTFTTLVPMLGIRYQPPHGGFMYRATATPYVPLSGGTARYPQEGARAGASLSVGYAF